MLAQTQKVSERGCISVHSEAYWLLPKIRTCEQPYKSLKVQQQFR